MSIIDDLSTCLNKLEEISGVENLKPRTALEKKMGKVYVQVRIARDFVQYDIERLAEIGPDAKQKSIDPDDHLGTAHEGVKKAIEVLENSRFLVLTGSRNTAPRVCIEQVLPILRKVERELRYRREPKQNRGGGPHSTTSKISHFILQIWPKFTKSILH